MFMLVTMNVEKARDDRQCPMALKLGTRRILSLSQPWIDQRLRL
jgi:hypothetical protein